MTSEIGREKHQKRRALELLVLVLLLRPFGNLALAYGMRHINVMMSYDPLPYIKAMANPFVAGGIIMLILGLLIRMALLSVADLSYVLPLTASGYVISSILAWIFLQEKITAVQWIGTVLVFVGSSFVGTTSADTTEEEEKHTSI